MTVTRRVISATVLLGLMLAGTTTTDAADEPSPRRSDAHNQYAKQIWDVIKGYEKWKPLPKASQFGFGPAADQVRCFANKADGESPAEMPKGAVIVCEHLGAEEKVIGVTVFLRANDDLGYDETKGWYWAHFTPQGKVVKTVIDKAPYDRRGFIADELDGRLVIFHVNSPEVAEYLEKGLSDKHTTRIGAGPDGKTMKGPDSTTITHYLCSRPGFDVVLDADGRVWVFEPGSAEAAAARAGETPDKHVTRPGAGPGRVTLKALDKAILDRFVLQRAGFEYALDEDGRLWVFRAGSQEWKDYQENGAPAAHVTRVGAGPGRRTIKAIDRETIDDYLKAG